MSSSPPGPSPLGPSASSPTLIRADTPRQTRPVCRHSCGCRGRPSTQKASAANRWRHEKSAAAHPKCDTTTCAIFDLNLRHMSDFEHLRKRKRPASSSSDHTPPTLLYEVDSKHMGIDRDPPLSGGLSSSSAAPAMIFGTAMDPPRLSSTSRSLSATITSFIENLSHDKIS